MTVLFTDPFAGGNASPPNANWTNTIGAGLSTLSNQLGATSGGNDGAARVTAGTFPDDQYAQFTVKTVGGSDGGPAVRMDASGNCYFCTSFNGTDIQLYKLVAGSFTGPLVTPFTGTYAVNDVLRLEAQGTTIRLKKNGVTILTVTDTSLTTGRPGAFIFDGTMRGDDFEAGDFNTGSTISPSGLSSAAVFGTTVIGNTLEQVSPSGLATNAVFGTTVISLAGGKTIAPSGLASNAVFGTAAFANVAARTLSPTGIASAAVFGTTVVSNNVVSQGVPSAAVYGTAVVTVTLEQISPTGLSSAAAYGTATVTVTLEQVSPTGVATAAVYGTPTVANVAARTLSPSGVTSPRTIGSHTLTNVTPTNQTVTASPVASAAVFGTLTAQVTPETISPSGVVSVRRVGSLRVLGGAEPVAEINLPITRATTQQTTIRTLSFAVSGKELPYPVYRGQFSNRRSQRFLEQPGHNPFAGLDEEE